MEPIASAITLRDPRDRVTRAQEVIDLAVRSDDPELELNGRMWRLHAVMALGAPADAEAELAALRRLADAWSHPTARWAVRVQDAMWALLRGENAEARGAAEDARTIGRHVVPMAEEVYRAQALALARELGSRDVLEAIEAELRLAAETARGDRVARQVDLALLYVDLDREDAARAAFARAAARSFADLVADGDWLLTIARSTEVAVALHDVARAARLRDLIAPYVRTTIVGAHAAVSWGSAARSAGRLATMLGDHDAAEAHFAVALTANRDFGAHPWTARTRLDLMELLCRRRAAGDLARAGGLLARARADALAYGMPALASRSDALAERLETVDEARAPELTELAAPATVPTTPAVFRKEGEFWSIGYEGRVFRLRHTRGLSYLAQLLQNPGHDVHVTHMVRIDDGEGRAQDEPSTRVAGDLGDAGEVLDATARAAYRRRVEDLREDLAEAEAHHDLGRAARAHDELEAITEQLTAGMRGRRVASHRERARLTVTKGIGTALDRIARHHPALGRHLAATVRRGYFCTYVPDPRRAVTWHA